MMTESTSNPELQAYWHALVAQQPYAGPPTSAPAALVSGASPLALALSDNRVDWTTVTATAAAPAVVPRAVVVWPFTPNMAAATAAMAARAHIPKAVAVVTTSTDTPVVAAVVCGAPLTSAERDSVAHAQGVVDAFPAWHERFTIELMANPEPVRCKYVLMALPWHRLAVCQLRARVRDALADATAAMSAAMPAPLLALVADYACPDPCAWPAPGSAGAARPYGLSRAHAASLAAADDEVKDDAAVDEVDDRAWWPSSLPAVMLRWSPDAASIREKMVCASRQRTVKAALVGTGVGTRFASVEVMSCNDAEDLKLAALQKFVSAKAQALYS